MPPSRRHARGFAPLGSLRWTGMGLPAPRARGLRLAHAWGRIADERVARHATAVDVRRGVLEIEMVTAGADEATLLAELMPRLAGRLAAAYPDLGVKRWRLRAPGAAGERAAGRPAEGHGVPDDPEIRSRRAPSGAGAAAAASRRAGSRTLPELMERYLARAGAQKATRLVKSKALRSEP